MIMFWKYDASVQHTTESRSSRLSAAPSTANTHHGDHTVPFQAIYRRKHFDPETGVWGLTTPVGKFLLTPSVFHVFCNARKFFVEWVFFFSPDPRYFFYQGSTKVGSIGSGKKREFSSCPVAKTREGTSNAIM